MQTTPFDIVAGVPVPARERARKYNIDNLEIGELLVIPAEIAHTKSAIYAGARNLKISVSIRELDERTIAWMDEYTPDHGYKVGDTGVWRVRGKYDPPE